MARKKTVKKAEAERDHDYEPENEAPNPPPKARATKRKAVTANQTKQKGKKPVNKDVQSSPTTRAPFDTNGNFMSVLNGVIRGQKSSLYLERAVARTSVCNQVKQMRVFKVVSPFSRRTTALAWSPHEPAVCAAGSKGGAVIIWNYNRDQFEAAMDTDHPGGSIQHMKFDLYNKRKLYTCSIDGTFMSRVFREGSGSQNHLAQKFLDTGSYENWYTSFDVSFVGRTMLAGSNLGTVTLMTQDRGEKLWQQKLHKKKVSFIRFSPREPWLFVTASIDHTVKIWDIRTLGGKEKPDCLQCLEHEKGVNNAEFSNVDGTRLLTTDQHSQLRIYRSPHWTLESVLPHPHRQFQHLTPVKAVWHPLVDLVVVGRYPDQAFAGTLPGELRTIDIFDADTGKIIYQKSEPGLNKIMSLNQFSPSGDALLSCAGQDILVWKQKPEDLEVEYSKKVERFTVEEWPGYKPQPKSSKSKKKA